MRVKQPAEVGNHIDWDWNRKNLWNRFRNFSWHRNWNSFRNWIYSRNRSYCSSSHLRNGSELEPYSKIQKPKFAIHSELMPPSEVSWRSEFNLLLFGSLTKIERVMEFIFFCVGTILKWIYWFRNIDQSLISESDYLNIKTEIGTLFRIQTEIGFGICYYIIISKRNCSKFKGNLKSEALIGINFDLIISEFDLGIHPSTFGIGRTWFRKFEIGIDDLIGGIWFWFWLSKCQRTCSSQFNWRIWFNLHL